MENLNPFQARAEDIRDDMTFIGQMRIIEMPPKAQIDLPEGHRSVLIGDLYGTYTARAVLQPGVDPDAVMPGAVVDVRGWPETLDGPMIHLYVDINELVSSEQVSLNLVPNAGCSPAGLEALFKIIRLIDEEIQNPFVRQGLHALLAAPSIYPGYFTSPAALEAHHAFPGGLAVHSLEVAQIAAAIPRSRLSNPIGRDLLLAAGLTHDLGKIGMYRQKHYVNFDLGHEARTLMLVTPLVDWLREKEDPSVSQLYAYLLSPDAKCEYAKCPEAAALRMADRISATASAHTVAFGTVPRGYRNVKRTFGKSTMNYLRALERNPGAVGL